MTSLHQYLRITIVLWGFLQISAKREFTVELLELSFSNDNPDFIKAINYEVYGHKRVYVDFTLNKPLTEFDIKFSIDLINKDKSRINLITTTVNGCDSLESAQKRTLMNVIFKEALRVSNLPKKCPILADTLYTFKNYTIKDENIPIIMPIEDWQVKADFIVGKKTLSRSVANGRLRRL